MAPLSCSPIFASERARRMLSVFPRCDAPETFTLAIASVLAEYPQAVVETVTHPTHGLPRRLKRVPTIADVAEACDRELEPVQREAIRQARQREIDTLIAPPDAATTEERERAFVFWHETLRPVVSGMAMDPAPGKPLHSQPGTKASIEEARLERIRLACEAAEEQLESIPSLSESPIQISRTLRAKLRAQALEAAE